MINKRHFSLLQFSSLIVKINLYGHKDKVVSCLAPHTIAAYVFVRGQICKNPLGPQKLRSKGPSHPRLSLPTKALCA